MSAREIGCCGAYCKTCLIWQKTSYPNARPCGGCKLGYEDGTRDITKAKCKIKVCCFRDHKLETCADCKDYPCPTLSEFFGKNGQKYKQYQKQLQFIKDHGYDAYLRVAAKWKRASGKLA